MRNNLYIKIRDSVIRQAELKRKAGNIKFDKTKREEFLKYIEEYNKLDKTLDYIKENCVISPIIVKDIISKKEGKEYVLKTFREYDLLDGKEFYTGRFISCYLNSENKYFSYDKDGRCYHSNNDYVNYALSKENFEELESSLEETDSYVLARTEELNFIPAIPPTFYLEKVNFTKFFINCADEFASFNFQHIIRFELKQYLEEIDADEFLSAINEEIDADEFLSALNNDEEK